MIAGQDDCHWAGLPKAFIPKESFTQGEPPGGISALLQLQPNHWWSCTKCQWWVLPRGRRDHTAQPSPRGSEHATAAWAAAQPQPGVGSELSGCISYIQPQQPQLLIYIFPIISIFSFPFQRTPDELCGLTQMKKKGCHSNK